MHLFSHFINGWDSWGKVFQDKEAFSPLVRLALEQGGLDPALPIENLTPGTNAVFGAGDFVVKLYAPTETGWDSEIDFTVEKAWLEQGPALGLPCPRLLHAGEIVDRYLFRYLVMERIRGRDAGAVIADYNQGQIQHFVAQIQDITGKTRGFTAPRPAVDLVRQAVDNHRWKSLPATLVAELHALARSLDLSGSLWVHGDLNAENILVKADGSVAVIDFADCTFAPLYYELPPLILDLFHGDSRFVLPFLGDRDPALFLTDLIHGLALHDFGGDLIKRFCELINLPYSELATIPVLRGLLEKRLFP